MEHKNFIASLVIFIVFLYDCSTVDFVKASIVTSETDLTDATHSKLPLRGYAIGTVVQGRFN